MSTEHADLGASPGLKVTMLTTEHRKDGAFRILSLDGGGAKGFYTLGVLREIEGLLNCPLYKRFDLVFGTSTGAIIASLISLGYEVDEIHELYKKHVPNVMKFRLPSNKSAALSRLATEVFGDKQFTDVKTRLGVVATNWVSERPMIFKSSADQAHGRKGTFTPGFGANIAEAVEASCSAYPFFRRKTVTTAVGGTKYELADGGFCANNPTLYAIADAVKAMDHRYSALRMISVGVGVYPEPKRSLFLRCLNMLPSVRLLQKSLEINTQSMEQLREILFREVQAVRISDTYREPEMATDFMEHDLAKLNLLYARGRDSFAQQEAAIKACLLSPMEPPPERSSIAR